MVSLNTRYGLWMTILFIYFSATRGQQTTNEVPGSCPSFPVPEECPLEPDNECDNDSACTKVSPGLMLKCCLDGCGRRCVPPIPPPTPAPQKDQPACHTLTCPATVTVRDTQLHRVHNQSQLPRRCALCRKYRGSA